MTDRLFNGVREKDYYIAWYGGDEFVVLGIATADDLRQNSTNFADRLRELASGSPLPFRAFALARVPAWAGQRWRRQRFSDIGHASPGSRCVRHAAVLG